MGTKPMMHIVRTRGYKAGEQMANSLIEFIHLMYNKRTAKKVLQGLKDTLMLADWKI